MNANTARKLLKAANEEHVVEIGPRGWGLQHPTRCLPRLFDCEVHRACDTFREGLSDHEQGQFFVKLDQDHMIEIGAEAPEITANTTLKRLAPDTLAVAIKLVQAADGLQEIVDLTLKELVLPLLEKAEAEKHDDAKGDFECARQQGVADALRQVRIWLEDNEAVTPRADAREALAEWECLGEAQSEKT